MATKFSNPALSFVRPKETASDVIRDWGTGEDAVEKCVGRIESNPAILLRVMKEMRFLRPLVRAYMGRRAIFVEREQQAGSAETTYHPKPSASARSFKPEHFGASKRAHRRAILDMKVGSKRLRDAYPVEAQQVASEWKTTATIVEIICANLDPKKTVGEQISDEEAQKVVDKYEE